MYATAARLKQEERERKRRSKATVPDDFDFLLSEPSATPPLTSTQPVSEAAAKPPEPAKPATKNSDSATEASAATVPSASVPPTSVPSASVLPLPGGVLSAPQAHSQPPGMLNGLEASAAAYRAQQQPVSFPGAAMPPGFPAPQAWQQAWAVPYHMVPVPSVPLYGHGAAYGQAWPQVFQIPEPQKHHTFAEHLISRMHGTAFRAQFLSVFKTA